MASVAVAVISQGQSRNLKSPCLLRCHDSLCKCAVNEQTILQKYRKLFYVHMIMRVSSKNLPAGVALQLHDSSPVHGTVELTMRTDVCRDMS